MPELWDEKMKASMQNTGDKNGAIKSVDLSLIFQGVSENIWSQASLHTTDDLIKRATGETLNANYSRKHLEARYL